MRIVFLQIKHALAILRIGNFRNFSSIACMHFRSLFLSTPLLFLCACASSEPEVDVSVYKLKNTQLAKVDAPVVRAEQQKRLRGAVSEVEKRERLGEYFTVEWNRGKAFSSEEGAKVVFLYRQAGTASQVFRLEKKYPASQRRGVTEFSIVGEAYNQRGRVLNWRSELYSGDQLLAHEQSYLWQE